MSWLFGVKSPIPGGEGDVPAPAGGDGGAHGGGSGPGDGSSPPDKAGSSAADQGQRMAYQFDSRALERAAQAAKDLEKSGTFVHFGCCSRICKFPFTLHRYSVMYIGALKQYSILFHSRDILLVFGNRKRYEL